MARPKEFNQEEALRKAIRLFCRQGFAKPSGGGSLLELNVLIPSEVKAISRLVDRSTLAGLAVREQQPGLILAHRCRPLQC
jgi:hypothetical protein